MSLQSSNRSLYFTTSSECKVETRTKLLRILQGRGQKGQEGHQCLRSETSKCFNYDFCVMTTFLKKSFLLFPVKKCLFCSDLGLLYLIWSLFYTCVTYKLDLHIQSIQLYYMFIFSLKYVYDFTIRPATLLSPVPPRWNRSRPQITRVVRRGTYNRPNTCIPEPESPGRSRYPLPTPTVSDFRLTGVLPIL